MHNMSNFLEKIQQISKYKYQKDAYDTEDSTVVIAGPGSGKTTILTLKILKLLRYNIQEPQGLACLTFSREAAREFEDRLKKLGYIKRKNVFMGTVHSFCISEVLGRFSELYDSKIPLPIKVIPDKLKKSMFNDVRNSLGYSTFKMLDMDKERTLRIIGNSEVEFGENPIARLIADEYEKKLYDAGYIDYESIIIESTRLIQQQEYVRQCLSARYTWLVIDEYQDLGRPLHEMVLSLFYQTQMKIFAVGDPDQSIYGFSGAIPDYLMELYRRNDIISIELKNNYRSNQEIIDGSELVLNIPRNYRAMTRINENAEYKFVHCTNGFEEQYHYFTNIIVPDCKTRGIPLEEIAVLVGTNDNCKELGLECMRKDIPYYISRHTFDRTDFVKWLENCATWVNDKTKTSFGDIYDYWRGLIIMHRENKFMSEAEDLNEKKKLFDLLNGSIEKKDSLKLWIAYMLEALEVDKLLLNSVQLPDELDNFKKLYEEVSDDKYKAYSSSKFSKLGKPENQITISTRHSSKGLEFEVIIMMGMEEKHFPNWSALNDPKVMEESNRMCFVCVSRAKSICILMHSTNFVETNQYGRVFHNTYQPSRYLYQLYERFGDK